MTTHRRIRKPWLLQVLSKGVWLLGFLPQLLDLAATYIPHDFIPRPILNWLEEGVTWELTLILVSSGLVVSAYLVHRETQAILSEFISEQALLQLAASNIVFIHSEPVLTLEGRFQDGLKPDGLPVEAIVGATIDIHNIGQEEGELEWAVDLEGSTLPRIFHLRRNKEDGLMSDLPDRIPGRKLVRAHWRLECGMAEKDVAEFARALAVEDAFEFVMRYRTVRVGSPSDYSDLSLRGSLAAYRSTLVERWNKRGRTELAMLAAGQAAA
jgi:hypothetical protein